MSRPARPEADNQALIQAVNDGNDLSTFNFSGVNLLAADDNGDTALHLAVRGGQFENCKAIMRQAIERLQLKKLMAGRMNNQGTSVFLELGFAKGLSKYDSEQPESLSQKCILFKMLDDYNLGEGQAEPHLTPKPLRSVSARVRKPKPSHESGSRLPTPASPKVTEAGRSDYVSFDQRGDERPPSPFHSQRTDYYSSELSLAVRWNPTISINTGKRVTRSSAVGVGIDSVMAVGLILGKVLALGLATYLGFGVPLFALAAVAVCLHFRHKNPKAHTEDGQSFRLFPCSDGYQGLAARAADDSVPPVYFNSQGSN